MAGLNCKARLAKLLATEGTFGNDCLDLRFSKKS